MKQIAIVSLLFLVACQDPSLRIGATISGDGVDVSPSVSGSSGNVTVSVSP